MKKAEVGLIMYVTSELLPGPSLSSATTCTQEVERCVCVCEFVGGCVTVGVPEMLMLPLLEILVWR